MLGKCCARKLLRWATIFTTATVCTLTPIGVAMTGHDIYDPYKD